MTKSEAITAVQSILLGIDAEETNSDAGWWETTKGAAFGADRLSAVLAIISQIETERSNS